MTALYAWGIDIGAHAAHIGIVTTDGTLTGHAHEIRWSHPTGTGRLEGSRRLHAQYDAVHAFTLSTVDTYPPACIAVEQPSGRFTNNALAYSAAVVQVAVAAGLRPTDPFPFTIPSTQWKSRIGLKGNASKEDIAGWVLARPFGLLSYSQDHLDALAIACGGLGGLETA